MKALLLTAALIGACASTVGAGAATQAVTALFQRQQAAWNAGDIEAFVAEGYWDSPELTFFSGGDRRSGYDDVLLRYRERYQSAGAEMGTLEFSDLEVVPLGEASAMARGRWHLEFSDGEQAEGLFTVVLRRLDAGWRIVHDHTSQAE